MSSNGQKKNGSQTSKRKKRKPKVPARRFWGEDKLEVALEDKIEIAVDPAAVVRSLGSPPLSGRETLAEHYFEAVYDKVVGLGGALAAAGGLLKLDDEAPEDGDEGGSEG